MRQRARELWEFLSPEPDEQAVISAVFEEADSGLVLRCASLIIGPATTAEVGWPEWRDRERTGPPSSDSSLGIGPIFKCDIPGGVAARVPVSLQEAFEWLDQTLDRGTTPALGLLPPGAASLVRTRAPIRVSTHSGTAAGNLAVWLGRPLAGFFFERGDLAADLAPADRWEIDDRLVFNPAMDLLGIAWFESSPDPPPLGLLVGRMERRAWLAGQRLDVEHDLYQVHIGLEADRVDAADLELEVEERVNDELVWAERLRLEDLDLRDVTKALREAVVSKSERPCITLALPTLGRKVKRAVRLHHRDGAILDEWAAFNLVEAVGLSFTINGLPQPTSWSGDTRGAPDLVELLGAVARVRSQFAELRRGGMRARLVDREADGRAQLRELLEQAPGELLVVDPWLRDWDLFRGLASPVRVLVGGRVPQPPSDFDGKAARWAGPGIAPFHDRFFLWDGGGVNVGTSVGSSHDRLFRFVRLGAAESAELRERFALWWSDAEFERFR